MSKLYAETDDDEEKGECFCVVCETESQGTRITAELEMSKYKKHNLEYPIVIGAIEKISGNIIPVFMPKKSFDSCSWRGYIYPEILTYEEYCDVFEDVDIYALFGMNS